MSSNDSPRGAARHGVRGARPSVEQSGPDGGALTSAHEPRYLLYPGDCREVLASLATESIDAIVTDPPYELTAARPGGRSAATRGAVMRGFMGLAWDATGIAYDPALWGECLRVLKPGAHLLAFGGARTAHRMVCAIEDAGFEIRDSILWIYGSGFPKSKNLTGERQGWGSALKPAHEPIVLARKPLAERTLEANVARYGTGALNIDGCRVPAPEGSVVRIAHFESGAKRGFGGGLKGGSRVSSQRLGRWPANVIHDGSEEVLGHYPEAPGQLAPARNDGEPQGNSVYGALRHVTRQPEPRSDSGGAVRSTAARFFYCAKASRTDRGDGNSHPTVKPTALMAYLCRLVTPPGGTVLDPFTGSGSTGVAAMREGLRFIGIESQAAYLEIARQRIEREVRAVLERNGQMDLLWATPRPVCPT